MIDSNKIAPLGEDIDFINLLLIIWNERLLLLKVVTSFVVIGLLVAFLSPIKYKATTTLLPSNSDGALSEMGGMSGLASMAGINIGSMFGGDPSSIPVEVYPQIVESYVFKRDLMQERFHYKGYEEPISLYDYCVADTVLNFGQLVLKYTLQLPWTLKEMSKKSRVNNSLIDYGVPISSTEELKVLKSLEDFFEIEVDPNIGLITLSAEDTEPILVAQKVQSAVMLLQEYIRNHKTKQARENLAFLQSQYNTKRLEYEDAQKEFFSFKDNHRNTVMERMGFEYQQLSDRYDIASSMFKSIAQQFEQAKVTISEQTPAFSIIDTVVVPEKKSAPKRKLIIVVAITLGLLFGISVIFSKVLISKLRKRLKVGGKLQ